MSKKTDGATAAEALDAWFSGLQADLVAERLHGVYVLIARADGTWDSKRLGFSSDAEVIGLLTMSAQGIALPHNNARPKGETLQ